MISWDIYLSIGASFLLMLVPMPVVFILLWRRKRFPVNSFFSGAAVFVVFYLMLRYYVIGWLGRSLFLSFLLTALFVESGRWAGLLLLPQRRDSDNRSLKTGLSLALGYITAAFLLINAFEMGMNLLYALSLGGWQRGAEFMNSFPSESVDGIQSLILMTPPYHYLLQTLALYLAVPVQVFLTLLIFQAYRLKGEGRGWWPFYGGAVLADVLYFFLGSNFYRGMGWGGNILFLTLAGALAVYGLNRLWKGEILDTFRTA